VSGHSPLSGNSRKHSGNSPAIGAILRRISSWRVTRPVIVPALSGDISFARSPPPYHLYSGVRSARAGAILPHVPHRIAEIQPALPCERHHQPPTSRSRRRDRLLDHRDQGGRLADQDELRFPAVRGFHPARPGAADPADRVSRRVDLLAAGFCRHARPLHPGELALHGIHQLSAYRAAVGSIVRRGNRFRVPKKA